MSVDELLLYSEWLDTQGLIVPDSEGNDQRTHEQLARDYLSSIFIKDDAPVVIDFPFVPYDEPPLF